MLKEDCYCFIKNYLKQFPAFRTRSFFEEKSKKGAQTIASIGARHFCFFLKLLHKKLYKRLKILF